MSAYLQGSLFDDDGDDPFATPARASGRRRVLDVEGGPFHHADEAADAPRVGDWIAVGAVWHRITEVSGESVRFAGASLAPNLLNRLLITRLIRAAQVAELTVSQRTLLTTSGRIDPSITVRPVGASTEDASPANEPPTLVASIGHTLDRGLELTFTAQPPLRNAHHSVIAAMHRAGIHWTHRAGSNTWTSKVAGAGKAVSNVQVRTIAARATEWLREHGHEVALSADLEEIVQAELAAPAPAEVTASGVEQVRAALGQPTTMDTTDIDAPVPAPAGTVINPVVDTQWLARLSAAAAADDVAAQLGFTRTTDAARAYRHRNTPGWDTVVLAGSRTLGGFQHRLIVEMVDVDADRANILLDAARGGVANQNDVLTVVAPSFTAAAETRLRYLGGYGATVYRLAPPRPEHPVYQEGMPAWHAQALPSGPLPGVVSTAFHEGNVRARTDLIRVTGAARTPQGDPAPVEAFPQAGRWVPVFSVADDYVAIEGRDGAPLRYPWQQVDGRTGVSEHAVTVLTEYLGLTNLADLDSLTQRLRPLLTAPTDSVPLTHGDLYALTTYVEAHLPALAAELDTDGTEHGATPPPPDAQTRPGSNRDANTVQRAVELLAASASTQTVVLVQCGSAKQTSPVPAKDLYTSATFRGARMVAEHVGESWFVLSAKHGLLHPERVTTPYDQRLDSPASASNKAWAATVTTDLVRAVPDRATQLVILAGQDYIANVAPALRKAGYTVVEPLTGLGIGERNAVYSQVGGRWGTSLPPVTPPTTTAPPVADRGNVATPAQANATLSDGDGRSERVTVRTFLPQVASPLFPDANWRNPVDYRNGQPDDWPKPRQRASDGRWLVQVGWIERGRLPRQPREDEFATRREADAASRAAARPAWIAQGVEAFQRDLLAAPHLAPGADTPCWFDRGGIRGFRVGDNVAILSPTEDGGWRGEGFVRGGRGRVPYVPDLAAWDDTATRRQIEAEVRFGAWRLSTDRDTGRRDDIAAYVPAQASPEQIVAQRTAYDAWAEARSLGQDEPDPEAEWMTAAEASTEGHEPDLSLRPTATPLDPADAEWEQFLAETAPDSDDEVDANVEATAGTLSLPATDATAAHEAVPSRVQVPERDVDQDQSATATATAATAAPVTAKVPLAPGMRVFDGSRSYVWGGRGDPTYRTWRVDYLPGLASESVIEGGGTGDLCPVDAPEVHPSDARITAVKVTAAEASDLGLDARAGWAAAYPSAHTVKRVWAKTKGEARVAAAGRLRVADWHATAGWLTDRDTLTPVDQGRVRPGDTVTLFDSTGTHVGDARIVVAVDDKGVALALPSEPETAVQSTVWARVATHTPDPTDAGHDFDDDPVLPDGVTSKDRHDFTNESCDVLAEQIAKRTGWPIVVMGADPTRIGEEQENDYGPFPEGWVHAGVRTPDGHILDVEGLHTEDEWDERWGEFAVDYYEKDIYQEGDEIGIFDAADFPTIGYDPDTGWRNNNDRPQAHHDRAPGLAEILLRHYDLVTGAGAPTTAPTDTTEAATALPQPTGPQAQPVARPVWSFDLFSGLPDEGPDAPAPASVPVPREDARPKSASVPTSGGPDGAEVLSGDAVRWTPSGADLLAPTGKRERLAANLAAVQVLRTLDAERRHATADEQETLARWSSWGALPEVFEAASRADWQTAADQLTAALDVAELAAASATTINAHYTDPRVAKALWDAATKYGITTGTVLEPGAGAGIFEALAPTTVQMVGVELDPITARINATLNPSAHVINADMGRLRLGGRAPAFDAAIGNVPFGDFQVHDPIDNPHRASIHNHFIAKALAHTRPGGLVIVLTSSWTMDSKRSTSRAHLASMGELLGAVRLPSGSMRDAAGTDVVIDVLVLRKYDANQIADGRTDLSPNWLNTVPADEAGHTINAYFTAHPDHVLGEVTFVHGQYEDVINVVGASGQPMADNLAAKLSDIVDAAHTSGRTAGQPGPVPEWATPGLVVPPATGTTRHGHIAHRPGQGFVEYDADTQAWAPLRRKIPAAAQVETQALLTIRDAVLATLDAQSNGTGDPAATRGELRRLYDAYTGKYGPITRHVLVERRPRAAEIKARIAEAEAQWRLTELPAELTPGERSAQPIPGAVRAAWAEEAAVPEPEPTYPHLKVIDTDPGVPLLMSLETYDETTREYTPTAIFERDLLTAPHAVESVDTADEALTVALNETNTVDLDRVASLLDLPDIESAFEGLGDLVYRDPTSGTVQAAHVYLSGDVRQELIAARDAAIADPQYTRNVAALQEVMPADVDLADVTIQAGARWLGAEVHEAFIAQVIGVPATVELDPIDDTWNLSSPSKDAYPQASLLAYGHGRRTPLDLLQDAMNNKPAMMWITHEDGSRSIDKQGTTNARAKQAKLSADLAAFIRNDPDRAAAAAAACNKAYRSYVSPDYTAAGARLRLPGLSEAMRPHPHQRAAVARILASPSVLLDHVVGAGKTGVMVMAATELRRLHIAEHPWVVVPNHLVAQVAREWVMWYPSANVLAVPTGASKAERDESVARAAVGNFDAVIVGRTTFAAMGLSPTRTAQWLAEEIQALRDLHASADTDDRSYIKRIERQIKDTEARHARVVEQAGKTVIAFEQSGCDYLFVDEAHGYKNLARSSSTSDLAHSGSNIARDLDYKLRALREARTEAGITSAPTVTFATGTPVANALAESWVMQHYLRPDLLDHMGITTIDAWARQFAQVVSKLELGPDGSTWRMKDRTSTFVNLQALIALNEQFTDTVTKNVLADVLPTLATGARQLVARDASPAVTQYVAHLASRANNLPDDPSVDNLLKISNDGRLVALDPRLRGLPADPDGGRVAQVADQIIAVHATTADTVYTTPTGPSPVVGGLQIVFCDRSTPSGEGRWNFYDALAEALVARGIPRGEVAFIHDAVTDDDRAALYARANSGQLRVLIGSTEKMGTGTNIQTRCLAIHHADCPWRPADLEQREGRAFRQGNQNAEVQVFQYVTTGTYDAVTWQIIERKAAFIASLRTSTANTIEDIGTDLIVSASLAQAIATGDERVLRRAELSETVTRLEALAAGWTTNRHMVRSQAHLTQAKADRLRTEADQLAPLLERLTFTDGDRFRLTTPDGRVETSRVQAGHLILAAKGRAQQAAGERIAIGRLGGVDIEASYTVMNGAQVWVTGTAVHIPVEPARPLAATPTAATRQVDPQGLATRVANMVTGLPERYAQVVDEAPALAAKAAEMMAALAAETAFPDQDALDAARAELAEIDEALQVDVNPDPAAVHEGQALVSGAELERMLNTTDTVRLSVRDVRAGSIVTRAGSSKNTELGTGQYVVLERPDGYGPVILAKADDPDGPKTVIRYSPEVMLIAVPVAGMDELERLAWQAPESDQPVVTSSDVSEGDRITTFTQPAKRTVEKSSCGGKSRESVSFSAAGEPRIVTGIVAAAHSPYGYNPAWQITTDDGATAWYMTPGHHKARPAAIRHDIHTPAPTDVTPLGDLLPGDVAADVVGHDGLPHPTLPATLTLTETAGDRLTLQEPDGAVHHHNTTVAPAYAGTVTPGPDLTEDQAVLAFGTDWTAQTVAGLRAGDRGRVCDLDPKAGKRNTTLATVVAVGYGSSRSNREFTYLPDGGTPATCRRREDQPAAIVSRRVGALNADELRQFVSPAAVLLTRQTISETLVGTRVHVAAETHPKSPGGIGTITEVGTETVSYGSSRHEFPKLAITLDDGETVTRKFMGGTTASVFTYPADVPIPVFVDPHDATPTWAPASKVAEAARPSTPTGGLDPARDPDAGVGM